MSRDEGEAVARVQHKYDRDLTRSAFMSDYSSCNFILILTPGTLRHRNDAESPSFRIICYC